MAGEMMSFKWEGLAELDELLATQLPLKAQGQVLERTLKKASKPIRDLARQKVVRRSGALAAAMSTWGGGARGRRQFGASVHIGPRRSNNRAMAKYASYYPGTWTPQRLANGIRHGHLVEFGHATKDGQRKGARPFMRPAMDAGRPSFVGAFRNILRQEINDAVAKARAKAGGK